MKDIRYDWISQRRFWKIGIRDEYDWKNVMFTDETPMPLGIQDLIHNITRLPNEKWNDDCCIPDFKKPMKLQFFGAIAYNWKGACYIFDTETDIERITLIEALQSSHKHQYIAQMEAFGVKAMNYFMAKAFKETAHPRQYWKTLKIGRMPAKPRPGPGRSKGGGIDWYRFVSEVLEPLFLSDYDDLRRQRPKLMLMLDGAAAHVSANCSPFYEGWAVNRLDWPGNSPDLNPIEYIWELLKKRIKKKYPVIKGIEALKAIWNNEWDLLSLDDINKAIEGQPKAVMRCYNHQGNNDFHG
jgi:transposase